MFAGNKAEAVFTKYTAQISMSTVPAKRLTIPNTNIGQFFYFTGMGVLKNYETPYCVVF